MPEQPFKLPFSPGVELEARVTVIEERLKVLEHALSTLHASDAYNAREVAREAKAIAVQLDDRLALVELATKEHEDRLDTLRAFHHWATARMGGVIQLEERTERQEYIVEGTVLFWAGYEPPPGWEWYERHTHIIPKNWDTDPVQQWIIKQGENPEDTP